MNIKKLITPLHILEEKYIAKTGRDWFLRIDRRNESNDDEGWIVDSGASSHMTPEKEELKNFVKFPTLKKVGLADENFLLAYGSGDYQLRIYDFQ